MICTYVTYDVWVFRGWIGCIVCVLEVVRQTMNTSSKWISKKGKFDTVLFQGKIPIRQNDGTHSAFSKGILIWFCFCMGRLLLLCTIERWPGHKRSCPVYPCWWWRNARNIHDESSKQETFYAYTYQKHRHVMSTFGGVLRDGNRQSMDKMEWSTVCPVHTINNNQRPSPTVHSLVS